MISQAITSPSARVGRCRRHDPPSIVSAVPEQPPIELLTSHRLPCTEQPNGDRRFATSSPRTKNSEHFVCT
jgi:hypothetical protein